MHRVTLIPGDGIGPEVVESAKRCVEAAGVQIQWDVVSAGEIAIKEYNTPLPDYVIESIRKNKVALKGPIITPVGSGFRSVNVNLRKELDLYACVRPCKTYEGVRSNYKDIDIVVIRENTEDLYAGIETGVNSSQTRDLIECIKRLTGQDIRSDSAISLKPISIFGTRRIVDFAFRYALENNRRRVTVVHKANIMKHTDGLFLDIAREVASKYDGKIEFEDRIVDNMCMQLVQKPQLYDVLVLPNLYGDIVSDLCAGLVGGLGMAPGANIGDDIALFEPTHGAAPKYKGLNKINPSAIILSAVLMLRYIGEKESAQRLETALAEVIKEGKVVTYDLVKENEPASGTSQMTDEIIKKIHSLQSI